MSANCLLSSTISEIYQSFGLPSRQAGILSDEWGGLYRPVFSSKYVPLVQEENLITMIAFRKIAKLFFIITLLSQAQFAQSAVVGPETPITPTFSAAASAQDSVAIAASPYGYFAVWQDSRSGSGVDIFGARISAAGQVLDVMSIPISTAPGDQFNPAVAWDGQRYLVVWTDRRSKVQHIYGCRVTTSGEVLDPQGILLSDSTGSQSLPRVAGCGTGSLVVWQDERSTSPDIYCCSVSQDGVPGKSYGVSTRGDNEEMPDVAYNGSTFLVAWEDYRNEVSTYADIYAVRVSKAGIRSGSEVLVSCTTSGTAGAANAQLYPRVCAFGSSWLVAWQDYRNDSLHPDIYGSRVSSTAQILDKGGIAISKATGDQEYPAVGYNNSKLLVVWRNGSDKRVRGARLNTSGGVLDNNGISISSGAGGSNGHAVAAVGSSFIVGWGSLNAGGNDVLYSLVSDAGQAQTPAGTVGSLGLDNQQDYAVAYNGSEYAVVWSQTVNGSKDILGARISKTGTILTPTPVNLTSDSIGDQTQPAIAWNGSKYLLVWRGSETFTTTDQDIRGRFLDSKLTAQGATPIVICSAAEEQLRPTVSSNGSSFFVAWQDNRNAVSPNYECDLYGAIVSSTGTISANCTISLAAGNQSLPKASSDGANYMVVWVDGRGTVPAIRASRVTSAGAVQDSSGIALPTSTVSQSTPNICYGNGSYFVTWAEAVKIWGCRVTSAGALTDAKGITISSGTKTRSSPSACWDGSKYQVIWEDYRSMDSSNSDLYGTTVSSTGIVSALPEMAIVSNLFPQFKPNMFMNSGFGLLFYSNYLNYVYSASFVTLQEQTVQAVNSISEAKQLATGSLVAISGKVVSGSFTGFFYIQEPNRSSGIKVLSSVIPTSGSSVDVVGSISVVDGERQLNASSVSSSYTDFSSSPLKPLGIRGDLLGGASAGNQVPGITGGRGLNNIGLLSTTWGKVTSIVSDGFYIEPRQAVSVKVFSGSLTKPSVNRYVIITGISTVELSSGAIRRAILPRTQTDINVIQ